MYKPILQIASLSFFLSFLISCSGNSSIEQAEVGSAKIIDVNNATQYNGNLNPLIEDLYFIVLDTIPEALYVEASKLIFVQDKIVVLDSRSQKVVVFKEDGKLLFAINEKGGGPGEYEELYSMAYDYANNQLILGARGKFLWFDMQGDFVREVKSSYPYFNDMAYVGSSQFAIYMDLFGVFEDEAKRSLVLDSKAKRVAAYQPFNKAARTENSTGMYSHFSSSKAPLAVGVYSYDVWKFDSEGAEIAYRFDFGTNAMPNDFVDTYIADPSLSSERVREITAEKGYWSIYGGAIQETKEYIYFLYSNRKEYRTGLYDKKSGSVLTMNSTVKNDRGDKGYIPLLAAKGEYLVSQYSPKVLIGLLDSENLTKAQNKILDTIGKEEVPLLWFVKFKKFNEIKVD